MYQRRKLDTPIREKKPTREETTWREERPTREETTQ
jgi:hypothetical protein